MDDYSGCERRGRGAVDIMMQKIRGKLPELAVILFCIIILGFGVSLKEGYHMDELLSFELANAEFNPWIVPTQPEGRLAKFVHNEIDGDTLGETWGNLVDVVRDVIQNRGNSLLLSYTADVYEEPVWISAEQFRDYIYVDGTDDFNYLSVYFNVKDDNHPPLHFMLLHTISSVFQGMVMPFMGCIINIAAVVCTMLLLMRIGKILAGQLGMEKQGRTLGLLAALLYGISTGALASVLLIRMYCVMTCLCVASLYYHLKKWQEGSFSGKNKGLIAVTVAGFLTQYFFLFYCIVMAGVTAVLLWCHNRKKEFWIYIRSMICAAVIGVVCFPFAISHVFSSERGVEALGNLSTGLSGYGSRLASFSSILADRTFGGGLLFVLVILSGVFLCFYLKKYRKNRMLLKADGSGKPEEGRNRVAYVCMLVLPTVGYFLLAARMSPYLVDRYIMAVFPFAILTGTLLLMGAACYVERKSGEINIIPVVFGVLLALQLFRLVQYDGTYLYRGYAEQKQLAEEYGEYPCICVYDGVGYYENLLEFTQYEKTLLVTADELAGRVETQSIMELDSVMVLMKQTVDVMKVCEILTEKYGFVMAEDLLSDSVYGDALCLFVRE